MQRINEAWKQSGKYANEDPQTWTLGPKIKGWRKDSRHRSMMHTCLSRLSKCNPSLYSCIIVFFFFSFTTSPHALLVASCSSGYSISVLIFVVVAAVNRWYKFMMNDQSCTRKDNALHPKNSIMVSALAHSACTEPVFLKYRRLWTAVAAPCILLPLFIVHKQQIGQPIWVQCRVMLLAPLTAWEINI